jgi:hypothetical protein
MSGPLIVPLTVPGETPGDGTTLYIISIVLVVVSGFVVMARMAIVFSRAKLDVGKDDICICVALVRRSKTFVTTQLTFEAMGYLNDCGGVFSCPQRIW